MKFPGKICAAIVLMSMTYSVPEEVLGWEIGTHEALSVGAAQGSAIDRVARESLGLDKGILSILSDNDSSLSIRGWIERGSNREDDFGFFSLRFSNHFHHPLRSPWSLAGLNDIFSGFSSGIWAQTLNQSSFTGSWSWQETRERFYRGLTSPNKADRESFLAQTFRGLGHQIHLIQDASSVRHARNKSHLAHRFILAIRTR